MKEGTYFHQATNNI